MCRRTAAFARARRQPPGRFTCQRDKSFRKAPNLVAIVRNWRSFQPWGHYTIVRLLITVALSSCITIIDMSLYCSRSYFLGVEHLFICSPWDSTQASSPLTAIASRASAGIK